MAAIVVERAALAATRDGQARAETHPHGKFSIGRLGGTGGLPGWRYRGTSWTINSTGHAKDRLVPYLIRFVFKGTLADTAETASSLCTKGEVPTIGLHRRADPLAKEHDVSMSYFALNTGSAGSCTTEGHDSHRLRRL